MTRATSMFLGPTGYGLPRRLFEEAAITVLPPVRRGDVAALVSGTTRASGEPGILAIVDGRFGDVLAVGHREILAALDAGWQVWGLASMGAIRGAELRHLGMKGFGLVYQIYVARMIPDDEVAVLHGPAPDYRPLSEALIDLRAFLDHLVDARVVRRSQAHEIGARLAHRWFAERTATAFVALCGEVAGPGVLPEIHHELRSLPRYGLKRADLLRFLETQPWRAGDAET